MTPSLVTRDLSVTYGVVRALADANLQVSKGEIVGLIGPNGAGKTTFIDAVTGFTRSRGVVEFNGENITAMVPHQRARLGLSRTWQAAELFDDLTVAENLGLADRAGSLKDLISDRFRSKKQDSRSIERVLKLLKLDAISGSLPEELSQGQRKLVGVGRALMGEPDVVLLDEPAAGLDTNESTELGRDLKAIAAEGTGMLLVDHDMGLVLSVCTHVVVLEFGQVIASGSPAEILRDAKVIAAYIGTDDTEPVTATKRTKR